MQPAIAHDVPSLTTSQMIEVDRVMIEELGIDLPRMMENAGRSLATVALDVLGAGSVAVLAGPGGNGGGAMVAARHLANRGVEVSLAVARRPAEMSAATRQQLDILDRMGIATGDPRTADLVIDGLIGYSLHGAPRGRTAELISWTTGRRILSLDVPSGVDATSGHAPGVAVTAHTTMTLALPKTGLIGNRRTGRLLLADISVPPGVYARFGLTLDTPFCEGSIVEVDRSTEPIRDSLDDLPQIL